MQAGKQWHGWWLLLLGILAGILITLAGGIALVGHAQHSGGIVLLPGESVRVECAPVVSTATNAPSTPAPTATPAQTVTASPTPAAPITCGLVATQSLRVRTGPGTSYAAAGGWPRGVQREVTAFAPDSAGAYLWARHADGWSAVYAYDLGAWWAESPPDGWGNNCPGVTGWPPGHPVVPWIPIAGLLWHTVPGGNGGEMLASYDILHAAGVPFGVKSYADTDRCREAIGAGGWCILRFPPDCPDVTNPDAAGEAVFFMARLEHVALAQVRDLVPSGRLWIEPTNECLWDDLEWWRDWMLTAIEYAKAHDWPPLALPGLGPGYGDVPMFVVWAPALERLAETGGLFSMHAYTPGPGGSAATGLCEGDQWLAYRHRLNRASLDALSLDVPITITEAARGWGNHPPDEADFACWYGAVRGDDRLHSVALWTAGYTSTWPLANLNGHMVAIAKRVRAG